MPPKGKTNNPNGRPPGVPNKSTARIRNFVTAFIEQNTPALQSEFEKLDGKDKFRVIERLLPYVLPKVEPTTDPEKVEFEIKIRPKPTDRKPT